MRRGWSGEGRREECRFGLVFIDGRESVGVPCIDYLPTMVTHE